MPKIRVDAEPLILSPAEIRMGREGLFFVENTILITMPLIKGMEVSQTEKMTSKLAQPVKLRRNAGGETPYHLKLTKFNDFTVMVPVILAEIDSPALSETSSQVGCV